MVKGKIELISGCMFSGKSEELLKRLKRAQYAKKNVVVFCHSIDNRYNTDSITSHNGNALTAYSISNPEDIYNYINEETDVVGVDEIQFFDDSLINVCIELSRNGKKVVIAGLDTDFRGEFFPIMIKFMEISDTFDRMNAVCMQCGCEYANRTQRLLNGKPSHYNEEVILVGSKDRYEARCRFCHDVPGKI